MRSKSILGCVLAMLATLGCGGRRIVAEDAVPSSGGSAGSAGSTPSEGGAGANNEVRCHLGDADLVGGETVPGDACNMCTCLENGDVACTHKSCSCVDRYLKYEVGASFPTIASSDNLPKCLPTCGVSPHFAGDLIYSIDALPKGECDPYPYAQACVMAVHESCPCLALPGPVSGYTCNCADGSWSCSIYSHGVGACSDSCMTDAGAKPVDDGGAGCELTRQLTISSAGLSEELRVGATINILVSLTNQGPLDHDRLPGVELVRDSPYIETGLFADNAFYSLQAGRTETLPIPVKIVALPPPCSPLVFHLRTLSFNTEQDCRGAPYDLQVVVPLPNDENCPACPPMPGSGICSPTGLSCQYPGDTPSCSCNEGHWECAVNLN